jgi:hypothetical protein
MLFYTVNWIVSIISRIVFQTRAIYFCNLVIWVYICVYCCNLLCFNEYRDWVLSYEYMSYEQNF